MSMTGPDYNADGVVLQQWIELANNTQGQYGIMNSLILVNNLLISVDFPMGNNSQSAVCGLAKNLRMNGTGFSNTGTKK